MPSAGAAGPRSGPRAPCKIREQPGGLRERDGMSPSAGEVPEGLGDMRLSDADGPVQDHRLAGLDKAQARKVTDPGRRELLVVGEVEVLDRDGLLEAGRAHPALDRRCLPAGDLVLAEDLEELEMAEVAGVRLGEPGLEGVEHARQRERLQAVLQLVAPRHDAAPSSSAGRSRPKSWAGPCRCAGALPAPGDGAASTSVPAARMPFTVR